MSRNWEPTICVTCLIVFSALFGWFIGASDWLERMCPPPEPNHIPYPYQIQEMLRVEGYDLAVDGIIGNETLRAWHDYCERHSNEMANEMTAEAVREMETKERKQKHE